MRDFILTKEGLFLRKESTYPKKGLILKKQGGFVFLGTGGLSLRKVALYLRKKGLLWETRISEK